MLFLKVVSSVNDAERPATMLTNRQRFRGREVYNGAAMMLTNRQSFRRRAYNGAGEPVSRTVGSNRRVRTRPGSKASKVRTRL